jgi:hypothetical protein
VSRFRGRFDRRRTVTAATCGGWFFGQRFGLGGRLFRDGVRCAEGLNDWNRLRFGVERQSKLFGNSSPALP